VTDPADQPGPEDPFAQIPLLGDLMRLARSSATGPHAADQLAMALAAGEGGEPNVDPLERIRYEELARIAELALSQLPGLDLPSLAVVPVTRSAWARTTMAHYRPLLDRLTGALGRVLGAPAGSDDPSDPLGAMLAGLAAMMAPMWIGAATGSMVGHLARTALASYHLPVPRPGATQLEVVAANVAAFAEEWSLDLDELRLWVCLSELAHHGVVGSPGLGATLGSQLEAFVGAFSPQPAALEERLSGLGPDAFGDLAGLQKLFSDPELVLGAVRSPEQDAQLPRLEAVLAATVGVVDRLLDEVAPRLLGGGGRLAEAQRRRRVEASDADRFVTRLLGLTLTQATFDRGSAFADGVVERAGIEGLRPLLVLPEASPTPAEVDAPGLWLARIELD
jgi:putative hydrolase